MTKTPAPKGLGTDGSRLWRGVVDIYDLRVDELDVLERACRAADRVARMTAELGDEVTTKGSMGQVVVHPLIAEIRAHEAQVASLLARLKLPDEDAGAEGSRSTQARAAAQSRWAAAHGAGA